MVFPLFCATTLKWVTFYAIVWILIGMVCVIGNGSGNGNGNGNGIEIESNLWEKNE